MISRTAIPTKLIAALALWAPATVALGVDFESFDFNDGNFTELAGTSNTANPGNGWSTNPALLTDSFVLDGAYRVSKFSDVFAPSYLQIDNIDASTPGSRFLVVDVAGWDLRGPDVSGSPSNPEQIRFGFLDDDTGTDGSAITAQMQITRDTTTEGIQLEGSALGTGSTSLSNVAPLATAQPDPFTMVLELDKAAGSYEVFYKVGSGPSQSLGSGAVAPSRDGNSIRFVVNNNFGSDLDEFFSIDRVALTDTNPLDDLVTLEVNRDTGLIKLINTTGQPLPGLESYSLTSSIGALDTAGWTPITDNYDNAAGPGDGSVDADGDWSVTSATAEELGEAADGGDGGLLGVGQEVILSGPAGGWIKNPREDLRAQLLFAGDVVRNATVEFVGNGGERFEVGDLNFDGEITVDDWTAFIAGSEADLSALSPAEAYQLGDLNYGGVNSFADLALFKEVFEAANGAGSFALMIAGVPEPTSATLVAVLGAGLFPRRGRRAGA